MLGQLQSIVTKLTESTAVREAAAKAAGLAVLAGEKAGPVAASLTERIGEAGQSMAERAARFAAEMRHEVDAQSGDGTEPGGEDVESLLFGRSLDELQEIDEDGPTPPAENALPAASATSD